MVRLARLARYPSAVFFFFVAGVARSAHQRVPRWYGVDGWCHTIGHCSEVAASAAKGGRMQLVFTNVRLGERETKELMEYLRHHSSVTNGSMLTMCTHSDIESDVSGSRVYEYEPELNHGDPILSPSFQDRSGHCRRWPTIHTLSHRRSQTQLCPRPSPYLGKISPQWKR